MLCNNKLLWNRFIAWYNNDFLTLPTELDVFLGGRLCVKHKNNWCFLGTLLTLWIWNVVWKQVWPIGSRWLVRDKIVETSERRNHLCHLTELDQTTNQPFCYLYLFFGWAHIIIPFWPDNSIRSPLIHSFLIGGPTFGLVKWFGPTFDCRQTSWLDGFL
jgi:hypothetical protein